MLKISVVILQIDSRKEIDYIFRVQCAYKYKEIQLLRVAIAELFGTQPGIYFEGVI